MELVVENTHPARTVDVPALEALVRRVLEGEGVEAVYVAVVLTDHDEVLALNRAYLEHDYLTDVLSFPLHEPDAALEGEVYVDLDTAAERHAEFGASFEDEVRRYVVHGVLHLAGYDDATETDKAHMHALEDRYLGA